MLLSTKGIVIHHIKYSEKSVIAKIFTEQFGLKSFIINGVRNVKSKNKAVYLQPLSLVEITCSYQEKKTLQQVRNIKLNPPFSEIPFHIPKSSVAFFIAEVLYKSIKEEETNLELYNFLFKSIHFLDITEDHYTNFHFVFLAKFSKYLGFSPQIDSQVVSDNNYFSLMNGCFTNVPPIQPSIDPPLSNFFLQVFKCKYYNTLTLKIPSEYRKALLETFLDYYNLHLSNFGPLKSLDILEEILH